MKNDDRQEDMSYGLKILPWILALLSNATAICLVAKAINNVAQAIANI